MPTKYRSTLHQYERGSLTVLQSRANGIVRKGKLRKKAAHAPSPCISVKIFDTVEPIGFSWEKPTLPRGIVIADKYLINNMEK